MNLRDVDLREVNLRDVHLRDVNLRDVNQERQPMCSPCKCSPLPGVHGKKRPGVGMTSRP